MKSTMKKIISAASVMWNWLSGKKRRIAIIALLISKLFPEYTAAHHVAEIIKDYGESIFYIFGATDLTEAAIKKIKNHQVTKDTQNE